MTQEEKAKQYDEVLEKAKSWYVDAQIDFKKTLEALFPTIKENEDERVRKAIISGMKALQEKGKYTEFAHIPMDEVFTWLESLKDRVGYEANCTTTKEWSDGDEYMLDETIQHLKQLIEIDKAKHCACDVQYYQRDIDWLKSLKDRIQHQLHSPQEWSEEDQRNIQNIDSVLFYDRKLPEDTCVKLRNFLKTLKERIGWKPSEEQISSLRDVIYSLPHQPVLFTLYNDLRKLKGE